MPRQNDEPREQEALVLVADDSEGVRKSVRRVVETFHCRVLEAETSSAALEIVRGLGSRLAFAIIDILLPEEGGVRVMRDIKERFPDVPIIAVTGGGNINGDIAWISENVEAVLLKPFDNKTLSRVIDRLLD